MKLDNFENKDNYTLYFVGEIFVIWFSILVAPYVDKDIFEILEKLSISLKEPFNIKICNYTLATILFFSIIYLVGILLYETSKGTYRRGVEHGSARWGNKYVINKKYMQEGNDNKIFTSHFSMGLNGRVHRRNLNTVIIGGSGAGKTRFYCKPNIMQCNTSYFILDPKGEILRDTGNLLINKGYDIKVLDLINMEKSHCYNPFVYIKSDNDVQKLVTNLFKATTPKGTASSDPFWDTSASMLLLALIFYLKYEAPVEEQNFPMVMEMLRAGDVREDDETYLSPLDILFNRLERREPEHIAVKYYRDYRSASAKTLKSIQITLSSRLEKFNLKSLESLSLTDELDLTSIGEKKTALFAIIPDNDTSFNFLVSILYTQLFQQLFYIADNKYDGSLKVPVHFVMDEFNNVSLPDDFEKILSVARSRQVFFSIILQNQGQIKALFEKHWESIMGNCDEFLYLGGNEQSTHKYISELLGKATINFDTHGKSGGKSGNYSTNYQYTGRELLTPDEVRMLDDSECLLFIRGERPIKDKKYNILKHPNIKYTADGGGGIYRHGKTNKEVASISIITDVSNYDNNTEINLDDYLIMSSEEIEDYIKKRGND